MDAKEEKITEALMALSVSDRERLIRLAELAQVSPEALWPEVWEFGFDDIEDSILADIEAQADLAAGRTIPNDEVMAKLQRMLQGHDAESERKAS